MLWCSPALRSFWMAAELRRRPGRVGRRVVAEGLVADVDLDVVLLALQDRGDAHPVVGGRVERDGAALLAVAGGVVVLEHADQLVGLAQADDVGDVGGVVLGPAVTAGQHDAQGVGAGGADRGDRGRGLGRVPGVGVADAAGDERGAVLLHELGAGDVQAGWRRGLRGRRDQRRRAERDDGGSQGGAGQQGQSRPHGTSSFLGHRAGRGHAAASRVLVVEAPARRSAGRPTGGCVVTQPGQGRRSPRPETLHTAREPPPDLTTCRRGAPTRTPGRRGSPAGRSSTCGPGPSPHGPRRPHPGHAGRRRSR